MRNKIINQAISLVLLLTFPFSGLSYAFEAFEPQLTIYSHHFKNVRFDNMINLPSDIGSVDDVYIAPGCEKNQMACPRVIYIQDLHAHPDVQRSIQSLLRYIKNRHTPSQEHLMVALENTDRALDPSRLDLFPDYPQVTDAVIQELSSKGELTGPELFLIEEWRNAKTHAQNQPTTRALGVEETPLYEKNLSDFLKLLGTRTDVQKQFSMIQQEFSKKMKIFFGSELKQFFTIYTKHHDDEQSLLTYANDLNHWAERALHLSFNDFVHQVSFPNFSRLIQASRMEQSFDREVLTSKWLETLRNLEIRLPYGENSERILEMVEQVISQITGGRKIRNQFLPRLMLESLFAKFSNQEIESLVTPTAMFSLKQLMIQSEIDAIGLYHEMAQLEDLIFQKLARKHEERELLKLNHHLRIFQKLVFGELTRDEWDAATQHTFRSYTPARLFNEIIQFKNESASSRSSVINSTLLDLNDAFYLAMSFYQGAEARDKALITNTLKLLDEPKKFGGHGSQSNNVIVLVAGGFHAKGIKELLRQKQVSFIVLTPSVTNLPEKSSYQSIMLHQAQSHRIFRRPLLESGNVQIPPMILESVNRQVELLVPEVKRSELRQRLHHQTFVVKTAPRKKLRVGMLGLDLTGLRMMARFHQKGHAILGYDPDLNTKQTRTAAAGRLAAELKFGRKKRGIADRMIRQDFASVVKNSDVIFVNIDPTSLKSSTDYEAEVLKVRDEVVKAITKLRTDEKRDKVSKPAFKLFVFRSIVPFRTGGSLVSMLTQSLNPALASHVEFVYQPLFARRDPDLKELEHEQVVLGTANGQETRGTILMKKLLGSGARIYVTSARNAELAHYGILLYLAMKISFFNLYTLAGDVLGGDSSVVAYLAGLDKRILALYNTVGQGFGAMLRRSLSHVLHWVEGEHEGGASASKTLLFGRLKQLLTAVLDINHHQAEKFAKKIDRVMSEHYNRQSFQGATVTIFGVANRGNSKRVSDAPALTLIRHLFDKEVVKINIFDPFAEQEFKRWITDNDNDTLYFRFLKERIHFLSKSEVERSLKESLFAIIACNHDMFSAYGPKFFKKALGNHPLFDGWNVYGSQADGREPVAGVLHSLDEVKDSDLNYVSVGRAPIGPIVQVSAFQDDFMPLKTLDSHVITDLKDVPNGKPKKVGIFGAGYVGLITGAELADLGHDVVLYDVNPNTIEILQQGRSPIFEPGLDELMQKNIAAGRLKFSLIAEEAVQGRDVVFVTVGTPSTKESGVKKINLDQILSAADAIGHTLKRHAGGESPITIVIKSTVTASTFEAFNEALRSPVTHNVSPDRYDLVSNPEFLREGAALQDTERPDRIVLGVSHARAEKVMLELYRPRLERMNAAGIPIKVVLTDLISAVHSKYQSNVFLALNIVFANYFARIVEMLGGSWTVVSEIMARDWRISPFWFRVAGAGFGGSCFPKDVEAWLYELQKLGIPSHLISLIVYGNQEIKQELFVAEVRNAVLKRRWDGANPEQIKPLTRKRIALWGLAFKPNTDDIRDSVAFDVAKGLLDQGATIIVHDPLREAREKFLNTIQHSQDPLHAALQAYHEQGLLIIEDSQYKAAHEADGIVITTDWSDYLPGDAEHGTDYSLIRQNMRSPVLVTGRSSFLDQQTMADLGFFFTGNFAPFISPRRIDANDPHVSHGSQDGKSELRIASQENGGNGTTIRSLNQALHYLHNDLTRIQAIFRKIQSAINTHLPKNTALRKLVNNLLRSKQELARQVRKLEQKIDLFNQEKVSSSELVNEINRLFENSGKEIEELKNIVNSILTMLDSFDSSSGSNAVRAMWQDWPPISGDRARIIGLITRLKNKTLFKNFGISSSYRLIVNDNFFPSRLPSTSRRYELNTDERFIVRFPQNGSQNNTITMFEIGAASLLGQAPSIQVTVPQGSGSTLSIHKNGFAQPQTNIANRISVRVGSMIQLRNRVTGHAVRISLHEVRRDRGTQRPSFKVKIAVSPEAIVVPQSTLRRTEADHLLREGIRLDWSPASTRSELRQEELNADFTGIRGKQPDRNTGKPPHILYRRGDVPLVRDERGEFVPVDKLPNNSGASNEQGNPKSELRIVSDVSNLVGFIPPLQFLLTHHRGLIVSLEPRSNFTRSASLNLRYKLGTASDQHRLALQRLYDSAFQSNEAPKQLKGQVIYILSSPDEPFHLSRTTAERLQTENIRLVLLVQKASAEQATEFRKALTGQLKTKFNDEKLTAFLENGIVIRPLAVSLREASIDVMTRYVNPAKANSAVIASDRALLERVRPTLRFHQNLSDHSAAIQAELLNRVLRAVKNPRSFTDRFGIIEVSTLLTDWVKSHAAESKVRTSA